MQKVGEYLHENDPGHVNMLKRYYMLWVYIFIIDL